MCISRNNELHTFIRKNVLLYPGSKVYLSELMIRWVWKDDCKEIYEYINEEDPIQLKHTMYSINRTLNCIERYRKKHKKPFLWPEEQTRYNQFMTEKRSGNMYIYEITSFVKNKTTIEFIDDCKFFNNMVV